MIPLLLKGILRVEYKEATKAVEEPQLRPHKGLLSSRPKHGLGSQGDRLNIRILQARNVRKYDVLGLAILGIVIMVLSRFLAFGYLDP